jgi:hypothetical protein
MTTKPPVRITVRLKSWNNVARIPASETGGRAIIASSTSDGRRAAFCAAAKYFGLRQHEQMTMDPWATPLRLRRIQRGDVCANIPEIYTAFLE